MSERLIIDYIELPSADHAGTRDFFSAAFGWRFVDYGPDYSEIANAGVSAGIDASEGRIAAPLVILKADDLEAAQRQIIEQGGAITVPIFAFPGGRRFHFREPGGVEMAVWTPA